MNFIKFKSLVPKDNASGTLSIVQSKHGLAYIRDVNQEFIPPDITERESAGTGGPKVIIVSAAGAVGKSTFARELAVQTASPYWDLSLAKPVGQKSLTGTLVQSFGPANISKALSSLAAGKMSIVIDALDESRVKVTEDAFLAFLQDIADTALTGAGLQFVLFGRTQISELSWLALTEAGVPTALFDIERFTRQQANQYIEKRVTRKFESAQRMVKFLIPFAQARDLILDSLEKAVSKPGVKEEAEEVRDFVGYAPVLEAVCVLLEREGNYVELVSNLKKSMLGQEHSADTPITILRQVLEQILDRERNDKFVTNTKPLLGPTAKAVGWEAWDGVYVAREQCMRLLGRMLKVAVEIPSSMPPQLRTKYEDQLKSWLPEHPFLRDGQTAANVVFEAYLFAKALHENWSDISMSVTQLLSSPEYKPFRLLAEFYFLFKREGKDESVPPHHIPVLYDSLLSGETIQRRIALSIEGDEAEQSSGWTEADGEFEIVYMGGTEGEVPLGRQSFKVSFGEASELEFVRQLKSATILIPSHVKLGIVGHEFHLGPNVHLECSQIEVACKSLLVRSRPAGHDHDLGNAGTYIDSKEYLGSLGTEPIGGGDVLVRWPGCEKYPWTRFASKVLPDEIQDAPLRVAYRRFRRIALTLRSHSKGSLARVQDKIESDRVLRGAVGEKLLERLVNDGILRLVGSWYHWIPDVAAKLVGITWLELSRGVMSPKLTEYLASFIKQNAKLFA